ncbi:hypothetical protein F0562_000935 [Nyssa sinensis]|uniref:Uncharacterized protein n=1 Tax=Nyssa sinensis TaxID=561372 RepID=A0A5J5C6L0_9ASTE|nr:hypothetical protein F0562_000935 [Nyssa sinensis]
MGSFSGLGIGLSIVFGCILLVLAGELYYLWRKKRISRRKIEDRFTNYGKELLSLFHWKKHSSVNNTNTQELNSNSVRDSDVNGHEPDLELGGSGKDMLLIGFGEEGVESELMRLHNLCGPPRFLFTIKEETKEDLESDDGKSRKASRTRSLSDLIVAVETPFLSPLSSPQLKNHPLNSYCQHGFNPLFESSTDAELNRLRSSPPPKFKFLRNAEEKLMRRLMEEAEKRGPKKWGYDKFLAMAGTTENFGPANSEPGWNQLPGV